MRLILSLLLCALAGAVSAQTAPPQPTTDMTTPAANDKPSDRDPRTCLEFRTRQQVIACAEKYRSHRPAKP